jgi:hypothetical protein
LRKIPNGEQNVQRFGSYLLSLFFILWLMPQMFVEFVFEICFSLVFHS